MAMVSAGRFAVTFSVTLLATCVLLVPKIWIEPRQIRSIFDSVPLYFVNIESSVLLLLPACFCWLMWDCR
jgi:hypothetical protein